MDSSYKILTEILKNRLEREIKEKKFLSDTQLGYRKRKGTTDSINKERKRRNISIIC